MSNQYPKYPNMEAVEAPDINLEGSLSQLGFQEGLCGRMAVAGITTVAEYLQAPDEQILDVPLIKNGRGDPKRKVNNLDERVRSYGLTRGPFHEDWQIESLKTITDRSERLLYNFSSVEGMLYLVRRGNTLGLNSQDLAAFVVVATAIIEQPSETDT